MALGPNLKSGAPPGGLSRKRPVAAYLRSATQLEGDPLREQIDAIVPYARDHSMQLIRVYCDECGSGLRNGGRSALQQMFRDIESGAHDFDALLMLNRSRRGRFQNPDRGACLEFDCKKAGIEVHYCAEEPADDKIDLSAVTKMLKRFMANECERELAARERHTASTSASPDAANEDAGICKRPDEDAGGQCTAS